MSYSEKTKIVSNSEDQLVSNFKEYSMSTLDVSINSPQIYIDSTEE